MNDFVIGFLCLIGIILIIIFLSLYVKKELKRQLKQQERKELINTSEQDDFWE